MEPIERPTRECVDKKSTESVVVYFNICMHDTTIAFAVNLVYISFRSYVSISTVTAIYIGEVDTN